MPTLRLDWRIWSVVVLACVALSGCAAKGPAKEPTYRVVNGATYLPATTAEREYTKEAATLRLPPSDEWPQSPVSGGTSAAPEWYQVGYGRQAADRYWFCKWADVALNTSDPHQRHNAVKTIHGILQLYYYKHALVRRSRPQLVEEVQSARRGDLTALREDVRLNC